MQKNWRIHQIKNFLDNLKMKIYSLFLGVLFWFSLISCKQDEIISNEMETDWPQVMEANRSTIRLECRIAV